VDDHNVCVVSGANEPNEFYVALSYCWGGPQEVALTTETLRDKASGFSISCLPGTIRDAILVTHQLGIKYIWIDSLCIMQDSEDDKQQELPLMADYYRNSYVTICASTYQCTTPFLSSKGLCTKHPESGIAQDLVPLGWLMSPTFEVVATKDNKDDKVGKRFTKNIVDCALVRKECPWFVSRQAISSRAWTFQERVLSPRILLFAGRLLWQCHSSEKSCGGVDDSGDDVTNADHRELRRLFLKAGLNVTSTANVGVDDIADDQYNAWYKAVEEFTRRDLTFKSDKLPAISALAQVFRNATGDEYRAGLWRGDILRGLLWSTYPTLVLSKPPVWRAPSWSWASNDNEVVYKGLPPPSAVPIARVLDSSAVPLSDLAPLGELGSGFLEIDGPVIEMTKDMTKYLVALDNKLPRIEDNSHYRNQFMGMLYSKNQTDPGCRDWTPPDGHIMLLLLATPVVVKRSTPLESNRQPLDPVDHSVQQSTVGQEEAQKEQEQEQERDEETQKVKEGNNHNKESLQSPGLSTATDIINVSRGYTLSGLVLGPVASDGKADKPTYERLARFTTVGVTIKDYRELEKLVRTVIIV
jgi:hypothetical protein